MNGNDSLARAIGEWQRKHHVADDDPVIAVLELVRLQLQHTSHQSDGAQTIPPSFEEFRATIELLDRRSKAFVQQATDLITELHRFGLNLQRLNHARLVMQLVLVVLGVAVGALVGKML